MKKLIFTLAVFFLPIAGHGIMAILGNEDARFFLHWSMLIASLIGSGFGCLIVCGAAAQDHTRLPFLHGRSLLLPLHTAAFQ